MISRQACRGCRNDFYNGRQNCDGGDRCWSAKDGEMVTRYRIHYMTAPTVKGAFTKVKVPNCYHQANGYCFYKELPSFVKASDLNRTKRAV